MKNRTYVYVSSWSRSGVFREAGIGVYELDPETGVLTLIEMVDPDTIFDVSHVDRRRGVLYALNETDRLPSVRSGGGGQVFVYRIDPKSGKLSKLGSKPTWCPNPSYITIDAAGEYAVVANHGSKAAVTKIVQDTSGGYELKVEHDDSVVELFAVGEDGMLGALLDVDWHTGCGPEARQTSARPHSAVMSPDGTLFAVCDKGNDTVSMYRIDRSARKLRLAAEPQRCRAASLPRHCVFHPTLPYFYHNNENTMDLCAYRYDRDGRLTPIGIHNVVPDSSVPGNINYEQQGICIHPSGRFIYDVFRGTNVVAVFEIDEADGAVKLIQNKSIDDAWPRGCTITEDGRFLIVCGMDGGKIFVYRIADNGLIEDDCKVFSQPLAAYASLFSPGADK